jgi:hypothetical protein
MTLAEEDAGVKGLRAGTLRTEAEHVDSQVDLLNAAQSEHVSEVGETFDGTGRRQSEVIGIGSCWDADAGSGTAKDDDVRTHMPHGVGLMKVLVPFDFRTPV